MTEEGGSSCSWINHETNTDLVVCHDIFTQHNKATKTPLGELPINDYKPPSVKQLRSYIHIHMFETRIIPNGQGSKIPNNKSTVTESESGVKNLICVAHDCRGIPIKLVCPETNDDGGVILEGWEFNRIGWYRRKNQN